jgi:uncharacterized protein
MNPKDAKVLVVASHGPEDPDICSGPFLFASEAARLGARVEMVFILRAPRLLQKGVAENLVAREGGRPVRRFIDKALECGVEFYVCDAALKLCELTPDDLIEEVENLCGPSYLVTAGLESDLVLNF